MKKTEHTTLIFDLGGVIIDLDPQKTVDAFANLANRPSHEAIEWFNSHEAFKLYEKGLTTDDVFRTAVREWCGAKWSDQQIDDAWNAMLLGMPEERLHRLNRLRKDYQVFLLSNTNTIHINKVTEQLNAMGYESFGTFFDKEYYSHYMNQRKPDAEIYQTILDENDLVPEETLFFDDTLANLQGAAELGIQTFHVEHPDMVKTFFDE